MLADLTDLAVASLRSCCQPVHVTERQCSGQTVTYLVASGTTFHRYQLACTHIELTLFHHSPFVMIVQAQRAFPGNWLFTKGKDIAHGEYSCCAGEWDFNAHLRW
jgi:hypothetical protein